MAATAPADSPVRTGWRRWFFVARKVEAGEVYLSQRRVYIVPSGAGWGFALILSLLFIGSVNYNLSLGFALTFLMAACGIVDMHLTFRNLAYLYLNPGRCNPVFAGNQAQFEIHLHNRRRYERYAIWLGFDQDAARTPCDIAPDSRETLLLSTQAEQRGYLPAPRIRLQTSFPLGLLRAWSFWQPAMQVLVYPSPELAPPPLPLSSTDQPGSLGTAGNDDFAGVRSYQPGDPLKHLAWRQIARLDPELGGSMISKQFEGGTQARLCLDLAQIDPKLDLEQQLSRLCAWVLEAERQALPYAFRLGQEYYPSAVGE
ncbi:MAG: putative rane protein, partial [Pseudomonadota bacterium]